MSFRKKNIVLGVTNGLPTPPANGTSPERKPGTRPSRVDGRVTTSTGTHSLDKFVAAGHAGLPLGTSLLIQESGTTDYGTIILRYYAAEGLVQGHHVHVLGYDDTWRINLPALATRDGAKAAATADPPPPQMKIAWRYEALATRAPHTRDPAPRNSGPVEDDIFCHRFDLAACLGSRIVPGHFHGYPLSRDDLAASRGALHCFVQTLACRLAAAPADSIHRVIVPNILGPGLYDPAECSPARVLRFFHSIRALVQQYTESLTVLTTLSTTLHPRASGLTRWMEILSDGVLEITPAPHHGHEALTDESSSSAPAQGYIRLRKLPIYQERGLTNSDTKACSDPFCFRITSTHGMVIIPYSLPPLDDAAPDDKDESAKSTQGLDF